MQVGLVGVGGEGGQRGEMCAMELAFGWAWFVMLLGFLMIILFPLFVPLIMISFTL